KVTAVRVGVQVDGVGGEPAVHLAGDLGGFGGILGQVGGHHVVGDVAVGGHVDDAHLELLAPADRPAVRGSRVRLGGERDGAGGVLDRVDQVADTDAGRGRQDRVLVGRVGTVQADDRVEVHHGASLHLGGLAVAPADLIGRDAPSASRAAHVLADAF